MIAVRKQAEGWGAGVIPRLALDLKNELPEMKGFSETNLKRMVQFNAEYPELGVFGAQPAPQFERKTSPAAKGAHSAPQMDSGEVSRQPDAKLSLPPETLLGLPWFHHVILIQKIKDLHIRLWRLCRASTPPGNQ